mgnify:CR=1 FL=1
MKKILVSAAIALIAATSFAKAAPQSEQKSLLQMLFPPSENYNRMNHRRSDKSPIKRKVVKFNENYSAGTIVIDTSDRRLYHVLGNGKAMAYGIGVGRDGFTWQGSNKISRMRGQDPDADTVEDENRSQELSDDSRRDETNDRNNNDA